MIDFAPYYRNFGARRIQSLLSPRLNSIGFLPKNSFYHYVGYNPEFGDIDTSKLFLINQRKIVVDYPETLSSELGNPRKKQIILRNIFKPFHLKNKKYLYLKDGYQKTSDQNTLCLDNYAYLPMLYKYIDLPMTPYNEWFNINKTVFDNISEINKKVIKNHFFTVKIPDIIPSFALLNTFGHKLTPAVTKVFDSDAKLFVLEFFSWIGLNRDKTIFASLTKDDLPLVNIIFTAKDGRSCIVNLGFFNSWIKGQENQTDSSTITQLLPLQMQKVFLKFLLTLSASIPEEAVQSVEKKNIDNQDELEIIETRDVLSETRQDVDDDDADITDKNSYESGLVGKKIKINKQTKEPTEQQLDAAFGSDMSLENQLKEIENELDEGDTIAKNNLKNKGIEIDEDGNLILEEERVRHEYTPEQLHEKIYSVKTDDEIITAELEKQADYGLIGAAEFRKLSAEVNKYALSKDPYGSAKTVDEMARILPEELKFDENKIKINAPKDLVHDESMVQSSLLAYDSQYIKHVMKKDMIACVKHIQKAGVIVRNHTVEIDHSALGTYENHTLELKPIGGAPSTVRFRLPVVKEDGTFISSTNKYSMRKQRIDVPIRKVAPDSVALTSYYGKTFVGVSPKKANSSLAWIEKKLNEAVALEETGFIRQVNPAKVFNNYFEAPFIYNALADRYKTIVTQSFTLYFNQKDIESLVDESVIKSYTKNNCVICGLTKRKEIITVDFDDVFTIHREQGPSTVIASIFQLLQLPAMSAPVDFSELKVYAKVIPVGFVLAYQLGLWNLMKFLAAKYRTVEPRKQVNLQDDEYMIRFKDVTYVFSRKNRKESLILGGLLEFEKDLRRYNSADFDSRDVYLNILDSTSFSAIYVRELENMDALFVDPITEQMLKEMNEPQTFKGLLIRATELLTIYHHPDTNDMKYQRIRGYERMAGFVYTELTRSIRQFKGKNIAGRSKIDMSPWQVQNLVLKDNTVKLVEDINPIQNLKEQEVYTYVGEGGRSKDTMSRDTRSYGKSDLGVTCEATVDSSDVGVNAFLSANPQFSSMRGGVKPGVAGDPAQLLSTSALLAPGIMRDDGKRVNFASIQNSHVVACNEYEQARLRTSYDYVIGARNSDMFCFVAKQDGVVKSINDKGLIVEYADGELKGVKLGRIFGKAEGSVYPHEVISTVKSVGEKFKAGRCLAYNSGFFEEDALVKGTVVYKTAKYVTVALVETNQTHEDSCAISPELSKSLTAPTSKIKSVTVGFNQNLREVVKIGQVVGPRTPVMIIEDEITAGLDIFDDQSIETLKRYSNQTPFAGCKGIVEKIEVFYHGDKQDMSSSLKKLADQSDKELADSLRSSNEAVYSGSVNDDYRVEGTPLALDKAEIKIYITRKTTQGTGDKLILANQCKSEVSQVLPTRVTTESGEVIDLYFSILKIYARILNSPFLIGTTVKIIELIEQNAVKMYFEE